MPAFQIFSGALSPVYQDSKGVIIELERLVLDLELVVTVAGVVEWYLSFFDAPTLPVLPAVAKWYRETSTENGANGAVVNAEIVRTLRPTGGGNFAPGTYLLTVEVPRRQQIAKASFRAAGVGAAISLIARSATGQGPLSF